MTQTDGPVTVPSREWLERNLRLCLEAEIARGTIRVRFVVIETPSTEEYLRGLHNEAVNDIVAREADHIWNNTPQYLPNTPHYAMSPVAQGEAIPNRGLCAVCGNMIFSTALPFLCPWCSSMIHRGDCWLIHGGVGGCKHDNTITEAQADMRLRDAAQDAASWLRVFGWNRYGVAVQDDFDDHVPILAALDAALAVHPGEATESGCPCLVLPLAERCSPQCSCARPHMSGGCRYCARYGSMEQRLVRARLIAQAMP